MQGKVNNKIISKSLRSSLILLLRRYLIGGSSLIEAKNKLLAISVPLSPKSTVFLVFQEHVCFKSCIFIHFLSIY